MHKDFPNYPEYTQGYIMTDSTAQQTVGQSISANTVICVNLDEVVGSVCRKPSLSKRMRLAE